MFPAATVAVGVFLVHRTSHMVTQSAAQVHANNATLNFWSALITLRQLQLRTLEVFDIPVTLGRHKQSQVPGTAVEVSPLFPVERKTWTFIVF